MPSPSNLSLAALLSRARTAFTNAAAPDVQAALAPYGLDAERLADLLALVDTAEARAGAQATEIGEQYTATARVGEARGALDALLGRHRQLARLAHRRGTPAYRALALDGRVADAHDALAAQADTFYRVLATTPDLAAPLAPLRVDAAAIAEGQGAVERLRTALAEQARETGEAQQATAARETAVGALRGAFSDFVAVAKIALADTPQMRERLGLLER